MGRPTAKQLFQHALDTDNLDLAAMLITAGALEILTEERVAEQPKAVRAAILESFFLNNLQPARARA
jgi:hypothetical protein